MIILSTYANWPNLKARPKGDSQYVHISEAGGGGVHQGSPGPLPPRQVLDMHADTERYLSNLHPADRARFEHFARELGSVAEWAASHLHPSRALSDLDPWVDSLGGDLKGATTYQVTTEMIDLAESLVPSNPDLGNITAEELPSDWGFMWFDRPVDRPSVEDDADHPPLKMHAVSWAVAGTIGVNVSIDGPEKTARPAIPGMPAVGGTFNASLPCVRIREWGYCDEPGVIPRPLHIMGQSTVILTDNILTPLPELHLVHMIWILMGMEIVQSRRHPPENRQARKRAASLTHHDVHVITLRRPARDPQTVRHVDWTCTWVVRGHWRKAPHEGTFADGRTRTWVKPYLKGPEGMPLRASDLLYKLAR